MSERILYSVSQYQLEKHWKIMCAIWLHILIRNWVKIKCATRQSDDYTKRLLHRRFLRDKRPCGIPFNSRTDIRRVDQGPMEIFDETLRKREQVPLPSNIPDEGTLQNVDTETVLANFKATLKHHENTE